MGKNIKYESGTGYAGHEWVAGVTKQNMSDLGKDVADLLGDVFQGIYHLDNGRLHKTDWSNGYYIEHVIWGGLDTFDSSKLTNLVILCHDRAIRMEINPRAFNYLLLRFHRRNRDGAWHEKHPTIEQAVGFARKHYPTSEMIER